MYNEVIYLVGETYSTNEYGDTVRQQVMRQRFAKVKSVGMKEKYQALAVGLHPEIIFVLSDYYDYNDETKVSYNDIIYDVIRTYRTGTELEVVVSRGNA